MVFERWRCYNNIVHVNGHETPNNRLEDYIDSPWKLGAAPERPKGMRRNAKVPLRVINAVFSMSFGLIAN
ncbi:hypothetical protein TNCV_1337471 [Trichonephila clavipes]|nr:hypothetical protein TNCV_1337471 [Trichonephila clavipes]